MTWPSRPTVQQRISLTVAALVSLVLILTGLTVYFVESRRIAAEIDTSIANEMDALRKFAPQEFADERLANFLQSSYPATDTVVWAFKTDGTIAYIGSDAQDLKKDPNFPTRVRKLMDAGGVGEFESPRTSYRLGVLPIHTKADPAALVVTVNERAARQGLNELMVTFALLAALAVAVVVGVANLIAARALAPLRELRATAQTVAAGDTGERIEVTGHDDLAELQVTFNTMLDRLEEAMQAQRGMLDDAAHELRTPLTIIRGHLEVLDPSDESDVVAAQDLVISEVDRMSRLVSDLLVLAKTGRTDFLTIEHVDVHELLSSVMVRVSSLAERDWQSEELASGVIWVDEQRINQALVQLVDNAIKHTSKGDTIAVGARRDGHAIEFWVRDSGTGVSLEERDAIFERFAQAEPDSPGFGLGLSIVEAIAVAHGGHVSLDPSVLGASGATFRIRIDAGGHE